MRNIARALLTVAVCLPMACTAPADMQMMTGGGNGGTGGGSGTGGGASGNQAPLANAGLEQSVFSGVTVTLDGTGSTDPDGDALTYVWAQTGGDPQTLTVTAPGKATFPAPTATSAMTLVFQLTVSDGKASATDSTSVTVSPTAPNNHPPVANLTASPSVQSGQMVMLDASGSSDPDGDSLTYVYAQTAGPTVTLAGIDTTMPTFVAPTVTANTNFTFTVTVDDGQGATNTASATVRVMPASSNRPPTVTAGATQTVNSGAAVTLQGTATDPDGDTMTYLWTQTSGPAVTLATPTALKATFTAPSVAAAAALQFSLVATDSKGLASAPGTVRVNVNPGATTTAVITKNVSLHAVTRTSIVVFFMTDVAVAASVDYGVASTGEHTFTESAPVTRHVITLNGLTQDTTYKYGVRAGTATASGGFQTAMDYATNPKAFSFAVVGDARAHTQWVTVSNAINAKKPRFVVQTGDNNDAAGSAANWADYYATGKTLFANVPVFAAQGNHDTGSNYSVYNISPQSSSGSDLYYAAVYGNVGLVAINTNSLTSAQLTWVTNALNAMKGGPLFAFHHHPLYSCGSHGSSTSIQGSLKTVFETAKLTTDFTGHDHDLIFWSTINNVRYVVSGGGGTGLYALSGCQGPYSHQGYGFMMVNVNGAAVTETFYDQNGTQLYADPTFQAAGASVPLASLGNLVTY